MFCDFFVFKPICVHLCLPRLPREIHANEKRSVFNQGRSDDRTGVNLWLNDYFLYSSCASW